MNEEVIKIIKNDILKNNEYEDITFNKKTKTKIKELNGLHEFVYNMVWLIRTRYYIIPEYINVDKDVEEKIRKVINDILEKYPIQTTDMTQFDYGYYCGIYAFLNYINGEGDDISDLIIGDNLIGT